MTTLTKPFTIDTLGIYWDVCRATVFNRIKAYRMETSLIGNKTYIQPDEVARVDRQTLRKPGQLSVRAKQKKAARAKSAA